MWPKSAARRVGTFSIAAIVKIGNSANKADHQVNRVYLSALVIYDEWMFADVPSSNLLGIFGPDAVVL